MSVHNYRFIIKEPHTEYYFYQETLDRIPMYGDTVGLKAYYINSGSSSVIFTIINSQHN